MMSSIYPLFAAANALLCPSAYSAVFSAISAVLFLSVLISSAYMIRTACSASIIPTDACGHARTKSAPIALEFITSAAVP